MKCCVDGCNNLKGESRGICRKHYVRWQRHGDPTVVRVYSRRTVTKANYIQLRTETGDYKFEHVIMAEKALGKPLPEGALVHHVDQDGTNNNTKSPWNLIVCPDQKYHLMLHARARALGYEPLRNGYKLTAKQEAEIRDSSDTREVLSKRYKVTISTIKSVKSARRARQRASFGLS